MFEWEHLDQLDAETEFNVHVENWELNGPILSYYWKASMTIDLYKEKTKGGRIFFELPFKVFQV